MRFPSVLRRLAVAVLAILMVLATLGLAPTASAASSGDYSISYEFEIHENKTVDITMIRKEDGAGSNSECNPGDIKRIFKSFTLASVIIVLLSVFLVAFLSLLLTRLRVEVVDQEKVDEEARVQPA